MTKKIIGINLAAIGAALIVVGYLAGEYRDVWKKAILICMECIGLG